MIEGSVSLRFERAYRDHYSAVVKFAARQVNNYEDAQDIAAATYLTAWNQHLRLPDEPYMRSWLLFIARRHVSNFWRAKRRSTRLLIAVAISAPMLSDASPTSVRLELPFGLSRATLEEVMSALGSKDRTVLRLIYWNGYTHAAVANALGCSVNAVSLRVSRARESLRKRLRPTRLSGKAH